MTTKPNGSFWTTVPGMLTGIAAVVGALTGLYLALKEPEPPPVTVIPPGEVEGVDEQRVGALQREIARRLREIRTFLYNDPMTNRDLYNGAKRIEAHGVGVATEFENTQLRALLAELEQVVAPEKRPWVVSLSSSFEELAGYAPEAPFVDQHPADPELVRAARRTFDEIETQWQRVLAPPA